MSEVPEDSDTEPVSESDGREISNPESHPTEGESGAKLEAGSVLSYGRSEVHQTFAGPLPPPSVLAAYDEIVPGAAERILAMAEAQSQHRQELEQHVIRSDAKRADSGLKAGFWLSLTAIVGGVSVAILGHPTAGATIATAAVATLAGVFVYGSHSRRSEREEKKQMLEKKQPPTKSQSSD